MNRETALAASAAAVVAVALLVAAVVPGVLADPGDDRPTRPGRIAVTEVPISPGSISGDSVTLDVEARLAHGGPPTRNVTVLFRAVDANSGLVATTETVDVGDLTGDREVPVRANLTVEREGGYHVEVVVYRDGERVVTGRRTVSGLEALTPPYARSDVRFTDSEAYPPVSFSVVESGEQRTTLEIAAALTNAGDDRIGDLELTVVLRQADSNIVAARERVDVGAIRPGRTGTVATEVTVPAEYNYYIDVVLWRDGVVLDSARGVANLDPTRTISVNETEREVDLTVSDFETGEGEDGKPVPERTGTPAAAGTSGQGPGFGLAGGAAALLASVLLLRRWSA